MKSTYRSQVIREACKRKGVSLLAIRKQAGVHHSLFYRVILGEQKSSKVDRVLVDLLDIKQELKEVDQLYNLLTAPIEDERMISNNIDRAKALRAKGNPELEKISCRLTLSERRLLDAIIQHINTEKIEAGMKDCLLKISEFVVKGIRRYNRLCCDGCDINLPTGERAALSCIISAKVPHQFANIITVKAKRLNLDNSKMLRSILLWRMKELIEDLELHHLITELQETSNAS